MTMQRGAAKSTEASGDANSDGEARGRTITLDYASADAPNNRSADDSSQDSKDEYYDAPDDAQPQAAVAGLPDADYYDDTKDDVFAPLNDNPHPSFHSSREAAIDLSTERSLSKDTFSFIIFSNPFSKCYLLAALVFTLQSFIFILVCADVIDLDNKGNPFNLPPNVTVPVRITEVLAIIVAIITQDDVRKAINLLRDGYDVDVFHHIFGEEASKSKWLLSIAMRGSEGLLGLFVTFLLIMQSDNVLDLLLNFSAMEFVSLIDDVTFSLTCEGFFGSMLKREGAALSVTKYRVAHQSDTWKSTLSTASYFVVLFTVMITGWAIIFAKQSSGKYLCEQLFVQLDDSLVHSLGPMSGMYFINRYYHFGGRVIYFGQNGILGYCEDDNIWTLTEQKSGLEHDPCRGWVAASSESLHYDVTETTEEWFAQTKSGRLLPLDQTYIECYDCKYEETFCGESMSLGTCIDNKCVCTEGRYGLRCEFEQPCSSLEVNPRSEGFIGNRVFASKYYYSSDSLLYHRPIYTSVPGENIDAALSSQSVPIYKDLSGGDVDTIMFRGRRWTLTSAGIPFFISEAIDIDSRTDIIAYPIGLEWHPALALTKDDRVVEPNLSRSIDVILLCAECNSGTNPCFFEAACVNGTCEHDCPHGSSGTLCQIPPLGNARCNTYFNKLEFEYDGGDCCESSCVSTDEFTCGKDESGYVDTGYFHCKSTETNLWSQSGDSISGVNGAARSGSSVALGGDGGTILAVGDPGASTVRLFDKDGAHWVQRGQPLEGPPNSEFGLAISLSGQSQNVRQNALSSPLVTLAVGGPGAGLVRVYECQTNGCIQVGNDIVQDNDSGFGTSVSMSTDGNLVAVGGAPLDCWDICGFTAVYRRSSNESNIWKLHGNPIPPQSSFFRRLQAYTYQMHGYYVSLSGDGKGLAVGTIEGYSAMEVRSADLVTQVYKWNTSTKDWVTIGEKISKPHYSYETARSILPLRSIALSDDALAIGSFYSVDVFDLTVIGNVSTWISREVDLNSTDSTRGLVGWSVDLCADGSTLAVGTSIETSEDNEYTQVYKWNGTHYTALFNGSPAGETSSVSLSRDGNALAVGLPHSGSGTTTVYKFQSSSTCEDGLQLLRISLTTDGNPTETSWTLKVGFNETIESQSYEAPFTTFVEEFCVPVNECIKFAIYDRGRNGLNQPGVYSLMLDGEEVARGGNFDIFELHHFGDCNCPTGESLLSVVANTNRYPMNWTLTSQSQDSLLGGSLFEALQDGWSSTSYFAAFIEECIPDDCYYLNTFPATSFDWDCCICSVGGEEWSLNVTFKGTSTVLGEPGFCPNTIGIGECSSSQPIECDEGSVPLRIEINFNDEPWLTKWELLDRGSGNVILDGGTLSAYMAKGVSLKEETCKPVDACYSFKIDSRGTTGVQLFLDNTLIDTTNSSAVSIGGEPCLLLPSQSPSSSLSPTFTPRPTVTKPTPWPTWPPNKVWTPYPTWPPNKVWTPYPTPTS